MTHIVFTDRAVTAERRRCTLASDVETLPHQLYETRNYILAGNRICERTIRQDNLTKNKQGVEENEGWISNV